MPYIKAVIKTILACVIIYFSLKLCIFLLSPFLLSMLVCILIEPVIKILKDKLHLNRSLSIIVALLFFCGFSLALTLLIAQSIYKEIVTILKEAPTYYDKLNIIIQKYYIFLKNNFSIFFNGQNINTLNSENLLNSLFNFLVSLKDMIIQIIYSLPDIVMYISFSLISSFFISRDKEKILSFTKKYLPGKVLSVCLRINRSIINIVKAECILVGISTVQTVLGFLLLNINYAVLLGIIMGLLDILPIIGPGIVFIPWVIYNFISGNNVFAISLLCLYIIIIVSRQILETRLISGKLDIHPVIILISIYIGLKFFGILGAMLGPIISVALKMIFKENIGWE